MNGKPLKWIILEEMERREHILGRALTDDERMEVIREYWTPPTVETLRERAYRTKFNEIMASVKDDNGDRSFLSDGKEYVNVDTCTDTAILSKIISKLDIKTTGLNKSKTKAVTRKRQVNKELEKSRRIIKKKFK